MLADDHGLPVSFVHWFSAAGPICIHTDRLNAMRIFRSVQITGGQYILALFEIAWLESVSQFVADYRGTSRPVMAIDGFVL